MTETRKISIVADVLPFARLNVINVAGSPQYSMAEVADIRGNIFISVCGHSFNNDAPALNIIEIIEFLYGLNFPSEDAVALTIDMEPVMYGWRIADKILITSFKSKETAFNGHQNILGELTGADLVAALVQAHQQVSKICEFDPFLGIYIFSRMYRQQPT